MLKANYSHRKLEVYSNSLYTYVLNVTIVIQRWKLPVNYSRSTFNSFCILKMIIVIYRENYP